MGIVRSTPLSRAGRIALLVALVALALIGAGGCRRPDPLYDRYPRPIGTRDVVRAERRSEPLSEAERLAVETAIDRYRERYEALRSARIEPLVNAVRGLSADDAFRDAAELKQRLERHASIVNEIAGLDAIFLEEIATALGERRTRFVDALRNRRAIDRANALGVGDGGRSIPDLLTIVDRLELEPAVREAMAPVLSQHATVAAGLADAVGREQLMVSRRLVDLNERLGPPEDMPDVARAERGRDDAINKELVSRYVRAREGLDQALVAYADQTDRTLAELQAVMPADALAELDRRIMRLRVDDEVGRSADSLAFELLVAGNAPEVSIPARARVMALREQFVADDTELLRTSFSLLRSGRVPGELTPGGATATAGRQEKRSVLEAERVLLHKRVLAEYEALVPADVRQRISALRNTTRADFRTNVALLVGGGRVREVVAARPTGYGEERPRPDPPLTPERETDGGPLRMLLPPEPHMDDLKRLLQRGQASPVAEAIAFDLFVAYRQDWKRSVETADPRSEAVMGTLIRAMESGSTAEARRDMLEFFSLAEAIRLERRGIDEAFVANLTAAIPDLPPHALELWRYERRDLLWRVDLRQLPGNETFMISPEAVVQVFDVIIEAELSDEVWPCVADALRDHEPVMYQTGEAMRQSLFNALRTIAEAMIESRARGIDADDAMREYQSDIERAVAPLNEASRHVAAANAEAIDRVTACIDDDSARRVRWAYARAAFPRVLDDGRSATRALENALQDPAMSDGRDAYIAAVIRQRESTRDQAVRDLLAWGRTGISRASMRRRSDMALRFPPIARAVAALDEADARALRAVMGVMTDEELLRHLEIVRWFDDQVGPARAYD